MKTLVLDFDDLELGKPGLEMVLKVKDHYPGLKVTFFMTPAAENLLNGNIKPAQYREWVEHLKQYDWIEVCPHGFAHMGHEMKWYKNNRGNVKMVDYQVANEIIDASEHTFNDLGLPFKKIWKSPHWETSPDAYKALWDRGYVVAVDPNQDIPLGGPIYLYNWSINEEIPDVDFIKGHGHMFDPYSNLNAIQNCFPQLLSMPTDAQFKFVSEVVDGPRT